jgi:hypothetical protein
MMLVAKSLIMCLYYREHHHIKNLKQLFMGLENILLEKIMISVKDDLGKYQF